MDLLCLETKSGTTYLRSYEDDSFLQDDRVLTNLLQIEERYAITSPYFKCTQTEVKPHMRKLVASWMLEVCVEEGCPEVVFPLAMKTMDRFLSIVRIRKDQLQLLGAVCLFVASKLRQTPPLLAEKLCFYTDYSIGLEELTGWELLILSRLKWDLYAITPNDFLDLILRRLPLLHGFHVVRRHAQTFITLCATDFMFSMYPPSMIAAASIGAAIQGLMWVSKQWKSLHDLLARLRQITGIEVDCLRECLEQIEDIIRTQWSPRKPSAGATKRSASDSNNNNSNSNKVTAMVTETEEISGSGNATSQSGTPTEIQDVCF